MRTFFTVLILSLLSLELHHLFQNEPFKSGIKLTYAIVQCEKELNKTNEVIRCNDNAHYRKTKNNLIRID